MPGILFSILTAGTISSEPMAPPFSVAIFLSSSVAPNSLALSLASPAPAPIVVSTEAPSPTAPAVRADAPANPAP